MRSHTKNALALSSWTPGRLYSKQIDVKRRLVPQHILQKMLSNSYMNKVARHSVTQTNLPPKSGNVQRQEVA